MGPEVSKEKREKHVAKHRRLPNRILLIEDDAEYAQAFAYALEKRGRIEVTIAADAFEAANQMSRHAFDLLITDWSLPPFTGFSTLRQADHDLALDPEAPAQWFENRKVPVIVLTACDISEIERQKKLKGRFHFLGAVSKGQEMEAVLSELEILYANFPLPATG